MKCLPRKYDTNRVCMCIYIRFEGVVFISTKIRIENVWKEKRKKTEQQHHNTTTAAAATTIAAIVRERLKFIDM